MTRSRTIVASLMSLLALVSVALAQTTAPTTQRGKLHALVIVGAPGTPMYARHYNDRAARFTDIVRNAGATQIDVLSATKDKALHTGDVLQSLQQAAQSLKPEDQFVLVLMGHGAVAENSVTLMLAGPDLEMKSVAAELNKLKCRSQIVLNFSASAGDALALLGAPGRINIAGSMPGQVNDNDFAEFMLQALEKGPTDLLSAYNGATERYAKWVVRQKKPSEEGQVGWLVEGRESAQLFRKLYGEPDVPPERKFIPSPDSEKPDDPNVPVAPDASPAWFGRRVVTESPAIDDTGRGAPATAMTAKGIQPVAPGKDTPVGTAASKTVLGRGNG